MHKTYVTIYAKYSTIFNVVLVQKTRTSLLKYVNSIEHRQFYNQNTLDLLYMLKNLREDVVHHSNLIDDSFSITLQIPVVLYLDMLDAADYVNVNEHNFFGL